MQTKTVLKVLWILIGVIALAAIISLIALPKWKGIFVAGSAGFLILNLLLILLFVKQNNKRKRK